MAGSVINQETLKSIVSYNPETGEFRWLVPIGYRGSRGKVGDIAGHINKKLGYRIIGIFGTTYYEHRLAFLYMTGKFPRSVIDHIDMNKENNKWSNLREASRSQNHANSLFKRRNSTSVYRGVSWHEGAGKWQAHIYVGGKSRYLGLFDNEEEARLVYREEAEKYFGKFSNA